MESVASFLASDHPTAFSFEILPPLRGNKIDRTYADIERLMAFNPAYINITTHRRDVSYRDAGGGSYRAVASRRRPGTVAIAAAIRERFGVRPVPHIICGEYSRLEIEDQLIDLAYLGINDALLLRGDRERNAAVFTTAPDGHIHAESLCRQVTDFNAGILADGTVAEPLADGGFTFGVAGYPEKHEEAMNPDSDVEALRRKVEAGASYVVTQMFYDNRRYFDFVDRCRRAGITVPIIPGLKPLTSMRQMSMLPRIFHLDFPEELVRRLRQCTTDEQVSRLGIEWTLSQASELKEANVASIHFYAMHAVGSVAEVARQLY